MYPANFDTTNGGLANHTPISRDTTKPQASSLSSTLRSALLWFWDHPSGLGRQETTEEHGATRMHTQSPTSPFGVVHPTQNQLPLDVTPTTSTFANTQTPQQNVGVSLQGNDYEGLDVVDRALMEAQQTTFSPDEYQELLNALGCNEDGTQPLACISTPLSLTSTLYSGTPPPLVSSKVKRGFEFELSPAPGVQVSVDTQSLKSPYSNSVLHSYGTEVSTDFHGLEMTTMPAVRTEVATGPPEYIYNEATRWNGGYGVVPEWYYADNQSFLDTPGADSSSLTSNVLYTKAVEYAMRCGERSHAEEPKSNQDSVPAYSFSRTGDDSGLGAGADLQAASWSGIGTMNTRVVSSGPERRTRERKAVPYVPPPQEVTCGYGGCEEVFFTRSAYRDHLRVHLSDNLNDDGKSRVCGWKGCAERLRASLDVFTTHVVEQHHKAWMRSCPRCKSWIRSNNHDFNKHLKGCSVCRKCKQVFASPDALNGHKKEAHKR